MWPNQQETPDLVTYTKKYLMESFIFCARQCLRIIENIEIERILVTKRVKFHNIN